MYRWTCQSLPGSTENPFVVESKDKLDKLDRYITFFIKIAVDWVVTNVDYNIPAFAGKSTFHGLGVIPIICCSKQKGNTLKHLKLNSGTNLSEPLKHNSASSLSEHTISIFPYTGSNGEWFKTAEVQTYWRACFQSREVNAGILWFTTWFFCLKKQSLI